MKISLISDLHLAFGITTLNNTNNCEILILAGDICEIKDFEKYDEWFRDVCSKWNYVIYIMGNHEYYMSSIQDVRKKCDDINIYNLHIVENQKLVFNDVQFICATLWTDMDKGNPYSEMAIKKGMNDYRYIKYFDDKLTPFNTKMMHHDSLNFIKGELVKKSILSEKDYKKTIVVTHHAPSFQSVHEQYKTSNLNGGYSSDLEYLMYDHDIALWCHGHHHTKSDYMINNTRVLCNPHGYVGYETNETNVTPLTIEL
jgi:Icc-related predicted phosphoesterase